MFSKIRKLETELASLREKYAERTKEMKFLREKEFLKVLSKLFQVPFTHFIWNSIHEWEVEFQDIAIRYFDNTRTKKTYVFYRQSTILSFEQNEPISWHPLGEKINRELFVKFLGPIVINICKVNFTELTKKYLESDYPETLQSVLLILGTQKHSIFNLVGKDLTRIICQMALK